MLKKINIAVFVLAIILLLFLISFETTESYVRVQVAEASEVKETIKEYSERRVGEVFGEEQWSSFDKIIYAESKWIHTAQNPRSSAFGLGQFLNSTWASVDCIKSSDPYIQVDCTIKYIQQRYQTPEKAWEWWIKKKWF